MIVVAFVLALAGTLCGALSLVAAAGGSDRVAVRLAYFGGGLIAGALALVVTQHLRWVS